MWQLAIKMLFADRGKLATALTGVAFSVVLVNLQVGLLLGLVQKASLLVDYGQADLWVGHKHMNTVDFCGLIPERFVHRLRALDGVERVEPYIVMQGQARMPDGHYENVFVVGCEPASLLGNAGRMAQGDPQSIRDPDGILVDEYETEKLGDCRIGDWREINGRRARIVGLTRGNVGFTNHPYVFTTLERARQKYATDVPPGQCSYLLVKARPGTDLAALAAEIAQRVPGCDVRDRDTFGRMSMTFWLMRTGIGISFGVATLLGLLVGLGVVGQTLYNSAAARIKEFATLKALGADHRCVARFLLVQALVIALLGALLGLATTLGVSLTVSTPRAPVVLRWWILLASVALVTGVCMLFAWLPYWRVRRIDPACVLRS